MKLTYKKKLLFCFLVIFTVFAGCIVYFEQKEEERQKTEALENKLDGYAEIIHGYIINNRLNDSSIYQLKKLLPILPKEIRITIIKQDGQVLFDKEVENIGQLENHTNRPEILQAIYNSHGSHIRLSTSTQREYLYYAKRYSDSYFIRVALPYNIETKELLKASNMFIYIVVIMFVIVIIIFNYVAGRFGKSISQLKKFTSEIKDGKLPDDMQFPDDELGDIGKEVADIFNQKEKNKNAIALEREKLIKHFQLSEEGICIFSDKRTKIYANTHFIQYANLITDNPVIDVDSVLTNEVFRPIADFIENKDKAANHFSFELNKNGKVFSIQTIMYEDDSFEVTIKDITKTEKTRLLKQEMTNNIAHELRTPVTSLRGYLEILSEQNVDREKQQLFINRAYIQSIRLSNLIEDVSILSKIEESSSRFIMEKINLYQLVNEVRIDLTDKLEEHNIKLITEIDQSLTINGNHTLLYSIFRNLVDNSINYAGDNIEIHINSYMEDDKYIYLSYYDTGRGIEEKHLNRLFERFYRVNEGRTRDTGGSGLGLSIVKNAILFHKGEIQAKNRINGGLEFLFTLIK
jgi:two-component system OmpR family sensor kinase/two-component system phosphate regulon sensor histidine kinase PhoR